MGITRLNSPTASSGGTSTAPTHAANDIHSRRRGGRSSQSVNPTPMMTAGAVASTISGLVSKTRPVASSTSTSQRR